MDLSNTHHNTSDIINYNKTMELLDDIFRFKADRGIEGDMVSLIISYCEEHGYKIEEVGDILSQSKDFKKMFEKQAIKYNHFRIEKTDDDHIVFDDNEW